MGLVGITTHMYVVCPVHVNTIPGGLIGPVIIMRSTLTGMYFYRIQYLIHHATSIAMTSYLLALAYIHM